MKKTVVFLTGVFIGLLVSSLCFTLYCFKKEKQYVVLEADCNIEGVGVIKKGTVLKIDESMSEGFTRYILYLNLSDDETYTSLYKTDRDNLVVPYWLRPIEGKR